MILTQNILGGIERKVLHGRSQITNVKGMIEMEKSFYKHILVIFTSDKNHQWKGLGKKDNQKI